MFPSKAEGRLPLNMRVAVPIFTFRYTHDTILRLSEVSGIPQMQYFAIFITRYDGPAASDHPSTVFTAPLLPGFLLWLGAESTRRLQGSRVASPLPGSASKGTQAISLGGFLLTDASGGRTRGSAAA